MYSRVQKLPRGSGGSYTGALANLAETRPSRETVDLLMGPISREYLNSDDTQGCLELEAGLQGNIGEEQRIGLVLVAPARVSDYELGADRTGLSELNLDLAPVWFIDTLQ